MKTFRAIPSVLSFSLLFGSALAGVACSSSSTSSSDAGPRGTIDAASELDAAGLHDAGTKDTGTQEAGPQVNATLTLNVPSTFKGTPTKLSVAVFDQVPVVDPPIGVIYSTSTPMIVAGQSLKITANAVDMSGNPITGPNYLVVVLYMQGGGNPEPQPGVDYVVESTTPVNFTGSAIDLGTLTLALEVDGGF